jgi:2-polyprenyl-3-methyl-5-hydroxy-6-metoxy-1,4-benzoquinol methylase
MIAKLERLCWCGKSDMHPFSDDYLVCNSCGTLASQVIHSTEPLAVQDDQHDFYGKEYWLSHQRQDLGLPDIYQRARADLPERCLYWLRTLLSYKLPPANVLELGASHGGFVALLRWAGFDAIGTELSPWVVDFARQTFDVPMLLGDIDQQQQPAHSFDVIVLNDVLEHLPDPLGTLRHCTDLLKPDGIILIQTPSYPDSHTYAELVQGDDRFVEMLEAKEHLYLFSQRAAQQLFERLGYGTLHFMPALFAYDMYFVASKQPLAAYPDDQITQNLAARPAGRMIQALLDKQSEIEQLHIQVVQIAALDADVTFLKTQIGRLEADRDARLELIERQGAELGRIPALEADVAHLKAQLGAMEADRAARLELIERQGAELGRIPALEADVAYLKAQISAAEADRAARLVVIERQGGELGQLHHTLAQTQQRMEHVHALLGTNKLKYVAGMLPARWEQIQQLLQPPVSSVSTSNQVPAPEAEPEPLEEATPDLPEQPDVAAANEQTPAQETTPESTERLLADLPEQPELEVYSASVGEFNSTQTNAAFLDSIRLYNHTSIETLDRLRPLRDKRLLDIGASPHGYAMERALALGVAEYVGVGLDVEQSIELQLATGRGRLLYMNAEQLDFPDQSFDLVVSLSTFEHVGDVARVLAEIKRVLKPGGSALITFEPIWTCSYGHHLHHFGPIAAHMPDWAHLLWDANQMRAELAATWPTDGAISLDEAIDWTYKSPVINRIGIVQMRAYFEQSGMATEWMVLLPDEARDPDRVQFVAEATSLSPTELTTKGLSVFLNRVEDGTEAR